MTRLRSTAMYGLVSVTLLATAACGAGQDRAAAPAAPSGVTVQAGSATSAHVMWTPATADDGVHGYAVYRDDTKVEDVPAETTMVDVTGLSPSSRYTFTVRARGTDGTVSPPSARVSVSTPAAVAEDKEPPARPTGVRVTGDGPQGARLTWKRAPEGQGIVSYDIHQGGSKIHSVGGDATSARLTTLRPGTRYRFTVVARDAADNTSPESSAVEITTPHGPGDDPDTAPTDLKATVRAAQGGYYVDLSWLAPETDGEIPAYEIHLNGKFATTLVWGDKAPQGRATYTVHAGSTPGETLRVKLRAKLPDGTFGAFSEERSVVTSPSGQPGPDRTPRS
ncbi:fibronectin type III domain-containing protein [Streptomyces sp. NPDC093085]|uniref:fibronectin type III domain-containing protein n=1 Tax=Streptomyces sp. NPDC093085 TaxID=3155068 RepID=UPI0034250A8B